jgi:hypothetical protein
MLRSTMIFRLHIYAKELHKHEYACNLTDGVHAARVSIMDRSVNLK